MTQRKDRRSEAEEAREGDARRPDAVTAADERDPWVSGADRDAREAAAETIERAAAGAAQPATGPADDESPAWRTAVLAVGSGHIDLEALRERIASGPPRRGSLAAAPEDLGRRYLEEATEARPRREPALPLDQLPPEELVAPLPGGPPRPRPGEKRMREAMPGGVDDDTGDRLATGQHNLAERKARDGRVAREASKAARDAPLRRPRDERERKREPDEPPE